VPDNFAGNPIQFFDDFSWKSFIAMVWPVLNGQRGEPDPSRKIGDTSVPLVFETLKYDWEVFQLNPTDWGTYPTSNPCNDGQPASFGDLILASFSKFGNLGEAGFGNLVHALPAQNGTWVRYATAFNSIEYTPIFADKLYMLDKLKKASPLTFPNNAIDIKSSWIDMTGDPAHGIPPIANPDRYYTRMARVMDPVSGQCSTKKIGLVGIHIVHKTSSRPQWIWSSFEQVDTAPASAPAPAQNPPLAFGFNGGMPGSDPNGGFPPKDWAKPVVYNVVRVKPIHPSTQGTNAQYQKALGGVWQFYQLVMTQWPVPQGSGPIPPSQPGTPAFTFPGTGATTSFANVTLETWDQNSITTGCMNCHNFATQRTPSTDFLWALQVNAISPPALTASLRARQMPALVELKQLLEQAAQ